jgi:hypothetical protein
MITFVGGALALGTAFAAVAVVAFRHAAMPRWLAYPTAVIALICVVPVSTWAGALLAIPWLLVTSIWLYRAMAPAMAIEPPGITPAPPAAPTAA